MKQLSYVIFALVFALALVPAATAAPPAHAGGGVGSIDDQCIENGFDFGISKWEWKGDSYVQEDPDLEPWTTDVTGNADQANWTASPAVDGVISKEATPTYVHAGGTSGTVDKTEKFEISHITFCGNDEPEPYCGDGEVNQESEVCDDGNTDSGDGCSETCQVEAPVCEEPEAVEINSESANWGFYEEVPEGEGEYVAGPATPPVGIGSAELRVDSTGRELFGTVDYAGTPLAEIQKLEYSTYVQERTGSAVAPSLQLDIDTDLTDGDTSWQGRLVYEPYYTHTVLDETWQDWNTLDNEPNGNWWFSGAPGNAVCPISDPCTWDEVTAAFPNAGLRADVGVLQFKAGGPWADGFVGNVDKFVIGTSQVCEELDFEGVPQPICGDDEVNQETEECDGSAPEGYTCSESCELIQDPFCGDGEVNQESEVCDDGNNENGDGCSAVCQAEAICKESGIAGTVGHVTDEEATADPYYARYTGNPAPEGYSHSYQWFEPSIATCDPNNTPVVMTGTLDVSPMEDGDVAAIGLLDNSLLGNGNSGWLSGAYIYVNKNSETTVRIGPSDGFDGGEIVQAFGIYDIPEDGTLDVVVTIYNNTITVNVEGEGDIVDTYGEIKSSNNAVSSGFYEGEEFATGATLGWDSYPFSTTMGYDLMVEGCGTITCEEEPVCQETTSEIVSDEQTLVGEEPSVETFTHEAWTAEIPGATWIWETKFVENPDMNETVVFTRDFSISHEPVSATLDIATDNSYEVFLNGIPVGSDSNANNFKLETQDQHDLSAALHPGLNTLEIVVNNHAANTNNPEANPAGLLYKLSLTVDECEPVDAFCGDSYLNQEIEECDGTAPDGYACTETCELIRDYKPVKPILECVLDKGDDNYEAFFGYQNQNDFSVDIPVGSENKFTPVPQDRGQPTTFEPGRTDYYPNASFSIDFDGSNQVWTLKGPDGSTRTATASKNGPVCEPICGNDFVEEGEACDGSAPEGYTCTETCELKQLFTCEDAMEAGLIDGSIDGNEASVTNDADYPVTISLVAYEMYQADIYDQQVHDSVTIELGANETQELEVEIPACGYQIDLVCGEPKTPPFYDDNETIDFDFGNQGNWCSPGQSEADVSTTLSILEDYPQGPDYVFVCEEEGFEATSYDWYFGDGTTQPKSTNSNVFHAYGFNGEYTVACTARNGSVEATDTLGIEVDEPKTLSLSTEEGYPQGDNYSFACEAGFFEPESYNWSIYNIDEHEYVYMQENIDQDAIYHAFTEAGEHMVVCSAGGLSDVLYVNIEEAPDAQLAIEDHFPQGADYSFACQDNFDAEWYDWVIYNIDTDEIIYQQYDIASPSIFHAFEENGDYGVSCAAENSEHSIDDWMSVQVDGVPEVNETEPVNVSDGNQTENGTGNETELIVEGFSISSGTSTQQQSEEGPEVLSARPSGNGDNLFFDCDHFSFVNTCKTEQEEEETQETQAAKVEQTEEIEETQEEKEPAPVVVPPARQDGAGPGSLFVLEAILTALFGMVFIIASIYVYAIKKVPKHYW